MRIQPRTYYPYVTRRLIHLFNEGKLDKVARIDIEPEFGYVTRLCYRDGSYRITFGNDVGINAGTACDLAKDKGYTKRLLYAIGILTPASETFLLPHWASRLRERPHLATGAPLRTVNAADTYIKDHFGYPAFVKPVDGSKGNGVYKIYDTDELLAVLNEYEAKKIRVAILEQPVDMPDFRIVVLDGELINAYRRRPLAVAGDGKHTVRELLDALQKRYLSEGRDTKILMDDRRVAWELKRRTMTLDSIPQPGAAVPLLPISNLSAGGTAEDVTARIDKHWVALAAFIAKQFNLRLIGLDLACADITSATAAYSVLEVNAAPGLDHFASIGDEQRRQIDALYTRIFNTP